MSRILLITRNYPPAICGVGDHSARLQQEWEKMGHEVWIFTTTQNALGPHIVRTQKPFFSAAMATQIVEIIKEKSIEQLFWQYVPYSYQQKGLPTWLPNTIMQLAKNDVRQSIFFHEVSLRLSGDGIPHTVVAYIQRKIANRINGLVAHSFTSLPLYRSYFRHKQPRVVPVGTNLPVQNSKTDKIGNHIVCFANRIDKALLEAVQRIRPIFPIRLTLCGSVDTHNRNNIEAWVTEHQAADWVHLTGVLQPEDLANCIASAAIFFQPQITDKKGKGGISAKNGTIMAAMSLGKAIITCRGDMTDGELFRENENMLFVIYGDTVGYELALQRLLDDAALADKLGENAAHAYQEYAAWPRIARQLLGDMDIQTVRR